MKKIFFILYCLGFCGCAQQYSMPKYFEYKPVQSNEHNLATWQKITNNNQPIHIYIEGDGHAFYTNGTPTADPTPLDSFMRNLAATDSTVNVAYIARPCQFVIDSHCDIHDWTDARFSEKNINSVAGAIKQIADGRDIILIGYSGGALVTGIIIRDNPDMKIKKWITIAGVLNHHDWTNHFGDATLDKSQDLDSLPRVSQIHYVGDKDDVVPIALSQKWIDTNKLKIIHGATHNKFPNLEIDFN